MSLWRYCELIAFYPGFTDISGRDLNAAFCSQIDAMRIDIIEQMVNSIMLFKKYFALMAGNDFYEAKTVILTTGVVNTGTLPGESNFVGKGVSYCATCDGHLYGGKAVEIAGEKRADIIKLRGGDTVAVDGIFCLRDSISLSTLLPKLATENGHISVDRRMATNLPGVYAAGDCTGRPYQYAKAVGEGNIAAHSMIEYL